MSWSRILTVLGIYALFLFGIWITFPIWSQVVSRLISDQGTPLKPMPLVPSPCAVTEISVNLSPKYQGPRPSLWTDHLDLTEYIEAHLNEWIVHCNSRIGPHVTTKQYSYGTRLDITIEGRESVILRFGKDDGRFLYGSSFSDLVNWLQTHPAWIDKWMHTMDKSHLPDWPPR
jgi:hypothetical protein